MKNNLYKSILKSILVNKKVGTTITSKKHEKLQLWKNELKPYLDKLAKMGYIDGKWKTININLKILKPINTKTITQL
ncbi:MAG: hypothetical protein IJI98_11705 [Methanosphaera sp.]|uniref:hypothetical protein n=1 Tax=Methanosphaera sp. ISO3-F5 TaxID=1452353 RepID=UPI002B259789|nr:hypothetical protein [Methanosphaera sp. ISO3-F5]MBR0473344.1 hypothetical protein [Methanosphaera sp.]WQH63897.1 hypothetical protein PXD04_09365 [Methanosphaera sp. ISO3-F5]